MVGGEFLGRVPSRSFESAREVDRDATYFYYAWSVAHAFRALGIDRDPRRGQTIAWAEALGRELIRRQREDGTWTQPLHGFERG